MAEPACVPADDAPHVLVVDDDRRIRELLQRYLAEHGYRVTSAENAAIAHARMAAIEFDMVVLDVMMPGESGLQLARKLKTRRDIPILMLTARDEPEDRIAGLETGADDYLAKPFEPKELLLRMANALRRRAPRPRSEVRIGDCVLAPATGELRREGGLVPLTPRERDMLKLLARAPGQAVSRSELAEASGSNARSVDVQVNRLRRKIEPDPRHPVYLQTVRGAGYALMANPW